MLNNQHRHLAKINRDVPFFYLINDFYFGEEIAINSLLKNSQNILSSSRVYHTTFDVKIFPLETGNGEEAFTYSASRYELEKGESSSSNAYPGVFFKYSLQPNTMVFHSSSPSISLSVVLCYICSFGSIYTFLSKLLWYLIYVITV